jgi:hypothetical protein
LPEDVCSCIVLPSSSSPANNNNERNAPKTAEISPFVISLSRKKLSKHHVLPPLTPVATSDFRKSVRAGRRFSTAKSHKRPHSASQDATGGDDLAGVAVAASPMLRRKDKVGRSAAEAAAAHPSTPSTSLVSRLQAEKGSRSSVRQVNRVDYVRMLRARPVFYPALRPSRTVSRATVRIPTTVIGLLDLSPPTDVTGTAIPLRSTADRETAKRTRKRSAKSLVLGM